MKNRFASLSWAVGWVVAQLACAVAFAAPAPAPSDRAGVFTIVDGDVRVTSPGAAAHAVKVGDSVNQGDVVTTGRDAEAHLRMEDTSYLALRQMSSLRIEKFRADGGDDDTSVLRLLSGGIRAVSGWIGRYKPRDVLLHTPSITIGIRGTDHETRVIPEGSSEGEPGTYDRVYAGETVIKSAEGEVTVTKDKAGFHPLRARRARLLASVPGFFRPGPHEAEINRKHEEIQRQIDEKRNERRKAVLEKRAALKTSAVKTKQMLEDNKAAREEAKQAVREGRSTPKAEREAMKERRKALREQVQDTREKRKDFQEEKASATEEIKGLRREEAKRYRQELKADRKPGAADPSAEKP